MFYGCDATVATCSLEWLSVHRYTRGGSHGVTNITPLRGVARCSLFVNA